MKILSYKGYEGSAEVDMELEVCGGKLLFIPDLVTYEAETPKQLQHEFEAAVDDYLETCRDLGREPQKPFKGSFNVRVPPQIHRAAAVRAVIDDVSLNDVVVRALDCYLNVRADVQHNVTLKFDSDIQTMVSAAQIHEWRKVSTTNVKH